MGRGGGVAETSGGTLTIAGTTIAANSAIGGAGGGGSTPGTGGKGMGGGILVYPVSTLTVTGSTVLGNLAEGGSGGGDGLGGGVFTIGTTTITDTLITLNDASGGGGGGEGVGGGRYIDAGLGTTTLTGKTKVSGNFASTSNKDIYGRTVPDGGRSTGRRGRTGLSGSGRPRGSTLQLRPSCSFRARAP